MEDTRSPLSSSWRAPAGGPPVINGKPAGEGEIANVVPGRFSATETLDIGMDLGAPFPGIREKGAVPVHGDD